MRLVCPNYGNRRTFHRDISIAAKLKVNSKGEDLKTIFAINKDNIDGWYEPIYCSKCNTEITDIDE
jgi:hypothetical protein